MPDSHRWMRHRSPVTTVLVAAAFFLLATACAGADTDLGASSTDTTETTASKAEESPAPKDQATAEPATAQQTQGSDSDTSNDSSEPEESSSDDGSGDAATRLDDYLDGGTAALLTTGGGGFASFDQRSVIEEQRQIEQGTRQCMAEQGFVYNADTAAEEGFTAFFEATGQSAGLDAAEYAEREGFGISTSFDAIQVGVESAIDAGGAGDANADVLAEMSDGEQDAWWFALLGAAPEVDDQGRRLDPDTGEPIEGAANLGATGGCRYEAQTAVRANFATLAQLSDDLEELDDRFDSDRRVVEIRREWSDCMASDGWLFASEDEARDNIQNDFFPFVLIAFSGLQRGSIAELSEQQAVDLDAIQGRERSIAVKSLECAGDNEAELDGIRAGYEAEFIAANRSQLESLGG